VALLEQIFGRFRWPYDLLDIVLVFIIVYRLLLLIRGTRAVQVLTGLGIMAGGFFLSDRLSLFVLNYLLRQIFDYLFLIVIILFQDEIRRVLATIGRNPFIGSPAARSRISHSLDEIVKASRLLAAKRTGALVVLERQHGLKNYTEGATQLNGKVSAELLISIFQPASPIHDGAVVILGDRILAAGCFFPVNLEGEIDQPLGTRHRAALALTQETDAVVVVISEERGEISLVEFGEITRNLESNELRDRLQTAFDLNQDENDTNNQGGIWSMIKGLKKIRQPNDKGNDRAP
jgi:diadenylate cyclase